jgi:hypothetical protein
MANTLPTSAMRSELVELVSPTDPPPDDRHVTSSPEQPAAVAIRFDIVGHAVRDGMEILDRPISAISVSAGGSGGSHPVSGAT